jgi:phage gpG-like protein
MFRFRVEIAGEVQMDRGIARFADGVADYRPIWPVIEDDFYSLESRQFQTEGAAGGEVWAPLSPEYAAWKALEFPGQPILQRTGEMMASLTQRDHPAAVHVEERKTLTLGTTVAYAIFHQRGTSRMPARKEIQFTEAFKRMAMAHIQQYLVRMASANGFRTGRVPGAPYPPSWGSSAALGPNPFAGLGF